MRTPNYLKQAIPALYKLRYSKLASEDKTLAENINIFIKGSEHAERHVLPVNGIEPGLGFENLPDKLVLPVPTVVLQFDMEHRPNDLANGQVADKVLLLVNQSGENEITIVTAICTLNGDWSLLPHAEVINRNAARAKEAANNANIVSTEDAELGIYGFIGLLSEKAKPTWREDAKAKSKAIVRPVLGFLCKSYTVPDNTKVH